MGNTRPKRNNPGLSFMGRKVFLVGVSLHGFGSGSIEWKVPLGVDM
jgi:hypothetical protein